MTSCANEWLSYTTVRVVRIKDWRLGAVHLLLQLAIVAYLLLYTIVFAQRYRRQALDVVGSARLQLRPPAPPYTREPGALGYCGGALECRYLDQYDVAAPWLEPAATFAATRITETSYTLNASAACANQTLPGCAYAAVPGSAFAYYIANLEMFTLLLDHTLSAASVGVSRAAAQMPGKLVDTSGAALSVCDDYAAQGWPCDPNVKVGRVGVGADILPLRSLLRAAGVASLDTVVPSLNETRRYAGAVLVVTIEYSNLWFDTNSWSERDLSYVYSVRAVDDAEFKAEESVATGPGARLVRDRHGLRVLVKQSGTVGTFDFATLLISLTSGLGLLAVTTLVVDLCATRVMRLRTIYNQYKTYDTADTGQLEMSLGDDELSRFNAADLVNPPPPFLSRMRKRLLAGGEAAADGDDDDDDEVGGAGGRAASSLKLLAPAKTERG